MLGFLLHASEGKEGPEESNVWEFPKIGDPNLAP